jgi:hypothetical protein
VSVVSTQYHNKLIVIDSITISGKSSVLEVQEVQGSLEVLQLWNRLWKLSADDD